MVIIRGILPFLRHRRVSVGLLFICEDKYFDHRKHRPLQKCVHGHYSTVKLLLAIIYPSILLKINGATID